LRAIRGRDDARWLPSRHNFALFRLAAWIRLIRTSPSPGSSILIIDRHQSAGEAYATAIWVTATSACFAADVFFSSLPLLVALAAGLAASVIALQLLILLGMLIIGPLLELVTGTPTMDNRRVNSVLLLLVVTALALGLATKDSWVRFAAWQWLALLFTNGVAATILFALRSRVVQCESEFGGDESVL
jgi:hypothetical protein